MNQLRLSSGLAIACTVLAATIVLSGCVDVTRNVPATYCLDGHHVPYTSYPNIVVSYELIPEGVRPRIRQLADSLGLADVSGAVFGGSYSGSLVALGRKDGAPFNRMHSPELMALRQVPGVYYGPVAGLNNPGNTAVFTETLFLEFVSTVPMAVRDSIASSLGVESSQADPKQPEKYAFRFPRTIGEGIVDRAMQLCDDSRVFGVSIQIFENPQLLGK